MTSTANLFEKWSEFRNTDHGKKTIKIARRIFLGAIIVYLALRLTAIGWGQIWRSLPGHPLFYFLFYLLFFSLPLAEILIYRLTWKFPFWSSFPVFVKKRVYNIEVLGYSGEFYFYNWAQDSVAESKLSVLKTIRDNNIVSSVSSSFAAIILLVFFLTSGQLSIQNLIGANASYLVAGGVLFGVTALLTVKFRKYLFSMPFRLAGIVFGIHFVRLFIGNAIQIGQWAVAVPDVPLTVWFSYAAGGLILSRIPFIPSRDLVFLGAGVELSHYVGISTASVAGMLIVISALGKLSSLILFAAFSALPSTVSVGEAGDGDVELTTNGQPPGTDDMTGDADVGSRMADHRKGI